MVVIVRIDLDRYDLLMIAKLYRDGLITMAEAMESGEYKRMSDKDKYLWRKTVELMRKSA
jgi:hypothetical protein